MILYTLQLFSRDKWCFVLYTSVEYSMYMPHIVFTDKDAAALVDCAVILAKTTATDQKDPCPVAICCIKSQPDVMAVPTVSRRMDGAKALSFGDRPAYSIYCLSI
jgi:hypothetical protein